MTLEFNFADYWATNSYEMNDRVTTIRNLLAIQTADVSYARYGSQNDGGYVIADDLYPSDYVISFGVENNIDFEKAISPLVSHIDFYDYSVTGLPEEVPNSNFYQEKIGTKEGETSIQSCIEKADNLNIFLKIDIEGSEWETLPVVPSESLNKCRQILVEFHWFHYLYNLEFYKNAVASLMNLRRTHVPVYVHPNNNVPLLVIGNAPVPMVCEVLFLRKDTYLTRTPSTIPVDLFHKNDPDQPYMSITFP